MAKRTHTKHMKVTTFGDEIAGTVRAALEPGLWAMGDTVRDRARDKAPQRTGRLKDSGFVATVKRTDYSRGRGDRRRREMSRLLGAISPKSVLIGFAVWYANLIEDTGSKGHAIPYKPKSSRGRVRKVLKIPGIGFRRRVAHPGQRAQPFLGPALEAAKNDAMGEFAGEVRKRLEREHGA